ncbi:AsnC family transcriptional regulator [Nitrospirillum amazonense]|uniref:AsnC family transcriptional regulator n=1 Tax=Nitrospirillum amazonense TaxID=28077 RepID=A0A560ESF6_9PROT|nr:Lrp/AsnC family transcriptional regulator [Nitrospirillum amazonense]TWB12247.1 AsnC family transcriptional regulator [Nitrospirillum amazonense]
MIISPELDAIDAKLLEQLQADARLPMPVLSERVGLSGPACYRRVRRLREIGAIEREVAIVRPRTLGWPLTMVVLVTLERDSGRATDAGGGHIIDQFMRKIAAVPEVVEAWYVTGDHDFALRVVARDMEGYDELTRRILLNDENVRTFKTLVVMRQAKAWSPVPADRVI